jgi:hypothetical protein
MNNDKARIIAQHTTASVPYIDHEQEAHALRCAASVEAAIEDQNAQNYHWVGIVREGTGAAPGENLVELAYECMEYQYGPLAFSLADLERYIQAAQ